MRPRTPILLVLTMPLVFLALPIHAQPAANPFVKPAIVTPVANPNPVPENAPTAGPGAASVRPDYMQGMPRGPNAPNDPRFGQGREFPGAPSGTASGPVASSATAWEESVSATRIGKVNDVHIFRGTNTYVFGKASAYKVTRKASQAGSVADSDAGLPPLTADNNSRNLPSAVGSSRPSNAPTLPPVVSAQAGSANAPRPARTMPAAANTPVPAVSTTAVKP